MEFGLIQYDVTPMVHTLCIPCLQILRVPWTLLLLWDPYLFWCSSRLTVFSWAPKLPWFTSLCLACWLCEQSLCRLSAWANMEWFSSCQPCLCRYWRVSFPPSQPLSSSLSFLYLALKRFVVFLVAWVEIHSCSLSMLLHLGWIILLRLLASPCLSMWSSP